MQLNDIKWKDLQGGYRIPYDASIALNKLQQARDVSEVQSVYKELWDELHHQGDVGLASYYSLPHLIRIASNSKLITSDMFALVAVIEVCRHRSNPPLPSELENEYLQSLRLGVPELAKICLGDELDLDFITSIQSALAAAKGHISLAEVILKLDSDVIEELLDNY